MKFLQQEIRGWSDTQFMQTLANNLDDLYASIKELNYIFGDIPVVKTQQCAFETIIFLLQNDELIKALIKKNKIHIGILAGCTYSLETLSALEDEVKNEAKSESK